VPRRVLLLDQDAAHLPLGKGLRASDQETFWNETKFPDGEQFYDYKHAESGAKI